MDTQKSRLRHLAKTLTWRIIASLTTFALAYFIFGDVEKATVVMGLEFVLKMVLYYLHERAWFKFGRLGRDDK